MNSYINPRSKLLQHMDRLAALKAGGIPAPVNIEIDLSNRCSLGCEWCHFGYTHTRGPLAGKREKPGQAIPGGDLMDEVLAFDLVAELSAYGVRSVTWTGGGEPTLHPSFDAIINFAAMRTALDQGMYTNGGHINPLRAELLKQSLTWVYVSLDAADRQTYFAEKKVDRFEHALTGIRNLAQAEGDATIGVGYLIHAGNYKRAGEMLTLALDCGADYAQFRPAVYFDMTEPNHAASKTDWIDYALYELQRIGDHPQVIIDADRFRMYRDWRGHGYTTCYWAGLQTCITPDGSVWTCVNKREHAAARLGCLADESFGEIWQRGGPKPVDGSCRVLCRGHVPNLALQEIMADAPHGNFI